MKNIKNNNLTLKSLQAEIDNLKKNNPVDISGSPTPKESFITHAYTRSSLSAFWLIGLLISFANKIPIIAKMVNMLSLWYGRTTWWMILVNLRKVFILFNALIGLITMIKITGISSDNMLAGIFGLCGTYVEMLGSFIKNIFKSTFKWLYELFDPKPPTNPWPWSPKPKNVPLVTWDIDKINDLAKKQDIYKFPLNLTTSTSSDWNISTWLWYGGIAIASAGILYLGYILISDPSIITDLFKSKIDKGKGPDTGGSVPEITITDETGTSSGIIGAVADGATQLSAAFSKVNKAIFNTMNPFNYLTTPTENANNFKRFMTQQSNPNVSNRSLYPFTENNPYAPWYQKLKLSIFGESRADKLDRIKDITTADTALNEMMSKSIGGLAQSAGGSGSITPGVSVADVGLGTRPIEAETVWGTVQTANVKFKIDSIPGTPHSEPALQDVLEWQDHKFEKTNEHAHKMVERKLEAIKEAHKTPVEASSDLTTNPATSPVEAIGQIEATPSRAPTPLEPTAAANSVPRAPTPVEIPRESPEITSAVSERAASPESNVAESDAVESGSNHGSSESVESPFESEIKILETLFDLFF